MHKGRAPSYLSSEATAGLRSQHACRCADFGLGEAGDLLMDPGLPQPCSTSRLKRSPATLPSGVSGVRTVMAGRLLALSMKGDPAADRAMMHVD